jgi:methylated-DNA-[protein]-cysteine S-methyltransferase
MNKKLTAFNSPIGWIGILNSGGTLQRIKIGFASQADLVRGFAEYEVGPSPATGDRLKMKQRFQRLLSGAPDDLLDIKIDTSGLTEFQQAVVDQCRRIPFGKTVSYGQLAELAGRPKTARAVGSVMSKNRFPVVVPCHRVISAAGIGGFTAPQGLTTKRILQAIEAGESSNA